MNGYDLFDGAILRLGYNSSVKDAIIPRGKELINQILTDLNLEKVTSLNDEINLKTNVLEGVVCGFAMLLALSESDVEKHKMFCNIYNAKRAGILSKNCRVEDKLPKVEGGEGI